MSVLNICTTHNEFFIPLHSRVRQLEHFWNNNSKLIMISMIQFDSNTTYQSQSFHYTYIIIINWPLTCHIHMHIHIPKKKQLQVDWNDPIFLKSIIRIYSVYINWIWDKLLCVNVTFFYFSTKWAVFWPGRRKSCLTKNSSPKTTKFINLNYFRSIQIWNNYVSVFNFYMNSLYRNLLSQRNANHFT